MSSSSSDAPRSAKSRPNIVFVLCDNVGWGDFSCYGGSTPTPRIDKFASEGIRFNNYTVESQRTPTRSAFITGRQSVRCGTYTVIPGQGKLGLTPWEYTIAELLWDAGYATSMWGKWHLGDAEGRLPNDQGFDEWWGYKNSVDEAGYSSYALYNEVIKARGIQPPKIWAGKRGERCTPVRDLDLAVRPLLDEIIAEKAVEYIKRCAARDRPFFTYVALSHVHPPERAHPDFDQTNPSRLGIYADLIAEMDYRVGQIIDAVDAAGISEDTLMVFSSDNAALCVPSTGFGGSDGPFRGDFFTPPTEGSMRVPAMVVWPKSVPAGIVTEELISAHDWYKTLAALAGASERVPTDRPMDGVDAPKYLLGESEHTGRESLLFFGPDGSLMSVKWHNFKIWLRYGESIEKPIVTPQFPMIFDLGSDPGERNALFSDKMDNGWMFELILPCIAAWNESIAQHPNVKPGEEFTGYASSK